MQIELLEKIHELQLGIMDNIHEICENNNLTYYLIGGSALGAVRHGGFIPWDIDIDIAMPRKDYDLFVNKYSSMLDEKYKCHSWQTEDNYYPPHALVALKGSKMIQRDDYLNPRLKRYGIYLDIFPLDIAPDDEELQKKQAAELVKYKKMKNRKLAITYSKNSFVKRLIKQAVRLMYLPTTINSINKKQHEEMTRYANNESAKFWCSMASHYSYKKQCMPKEIYGTPCLVNFSGRQYFAPQQLDEYLTRIYNDYMKLPDKEHQQYQIDYFVDAKW